MGLLSLGFNGKDTARRIMGHRIAFKVLTENENSWWAFSEKRMKSKIKPRGTPALRAWAENTPSKDNESVSRWYRRETRFNVVSQKPKDHILRKKDWMHWVIFRVQVRVHLPIAQTKSLSLLCHPPHIQSNCKSDYSSPLPSHLLIRIMEIAS